MQPIDLRIAQLHVRIHCDAAACEAGIEALTRLFSRHHPAGAADLDFSFKQNENGTSLSCNNEHIWQGEEAGEVLAAFEWAFYNRSIALLYPRFISLHAASVNWQGHGITIAGYSGAGKSSLCTAALLHGAEYLSDEYSLLDEHGCISPYPRALQWGGETHPAFSQQGMRDSGLFGEGRYTFTGRDGQPITSLLWHPRRLAEQATGLHLLLLPRFDADAQQVSCEPLARSQAMMELAAETHHKLPVADRLRELHRRIPDTTAIYRIVFPDVHQAWNRVESLLKTES